MRYMCRCVLSGYFPHYIRVNGLWWHCPKITLDDKLSPCLIQCERGRFSSMLLTLTGNQFK